MEAFPEEKKVALFPKHCVVAWTFPHQVSNPKVSYYLEVRRPWSWTWRRVDEDPSLVFRVSNGEFRGFLLVSPHGTDSLAARGYEGSLWRVRIRVEGGAV